MKKLHIAAACSVAALAVGAAIAYTKWVEKQEFDNLTNQLVRALKDPASATFRDYRIVGPYICGEVNSKGGAGGYIGFKRFISHATGYAIDGEIVDSFWQGTRDTDDVVAEVNLQIAFLKTWHRNPTADELLRMRFDALWKSSCS